MVTFFQNGYTNLHSHQQPFESNRLYIPELTAVSGSLLAFPLLLLGPPADLHLSQFPETRLEVEASQTPSEHHS